jgi:carboxymethylenebutenolidase
MCHSDDSQAPQAPNAGAVAGHGPLELHAEDGNALAAYRAIPATPNGMKIVVLPDVRGLHPFYVGLTQRLAEAGYEAVAIDYFGRTAGVAQRDESFAYMEHMPQVTPAHVYADTAAAMAVLCESEPDASVYTVGFCFGGSMSWRLAASDLDLAGVIGFYGQPARVADVVDEVDKPILMLVAGADSTPVSEFEKLAAQLEEAGVAPEMHVYEGAPHSFFDRSFEQWADACTDAWNRVISFTARHRH